MAPSDLEFPDQKHSQVYLNYLSTIMWKIAKLPTGSYTRRRIISCLEYLTVINGPKDCKHEHKTAR